MSRDPRNGCCTDALPPLRAQPPGQTHLRTRVGTWAQFRQRMIESLTTQTVVPEGATDAQRPLQALTSRERDDGTIALLDAWAAVCDVLAFYDERILEEGFLGTAKQHRSVVEIARSLGYVPRPGVAAEVRLAIQLEDTPLISGEIGLDAGLGVMSIPSDGAQPQTFETIEPLRARFAYNAIPARQTLPQRVEQGTDEVWLSGIGTRLEPGNVIVLAHPGRDSSVDSRWHAARVRQVEPDVTGHRTRLVFDPPRAGTWVSTKPLVLAFRQRAGVFGANAPDARIVGEEIRGLLGSSTEWPDFAVGSGSEPERGGVHLDRETDAIAPGSFVFLQDASTRALGKVVSVSSVGRTDFTLSGRVTAVKLDVQTKMSKFRRRHTAVHFASDRLAISGAPDVSEVSGLLLDLDRSVPQMEPGRAVIVRGRSASQEPVAIETRVVRWDTINGLPRITLEDPIAPALQRATVELLGNVALATHGKSVGSEVIGNGDETMPNQRFALRQRPLTWTSAATRSGLEAALEVRINGVRWTRVDSLYGARPEERVYAVETLEDGTSEVVLGGRAPTGTNNVIADYRIGAGLSGEVARGRLTLLQTRPQGVFGAVNPSPASGAGDPESMDNARLSAPLHVLTLDRLVSVSDYRDYARTYPGIGKARATELWDGHRAWIQLTVAAASGAALHATHPLLSKLADAIASAADPAHVVRIDGHDAIEFDIRARVAVDRAYDRDVVEERIGDALVDHFSFAKREFGQPVAVSEVAARIHCVEGVVAVDVDAIYRRGTAPYPSRAVLRAALPRWSGGSVSRAELLVARRQGIRLNEMTP